jgi:16S rRNA (guanine527-N7)-methyltransferase
MNIFKQTIVTGAEKMGLNITEEMLEQFEEYSQLLLEENKKYNLTSITEQQEVAEKHFLDSLMISRELKYFFNISMIDIGSGAGFPGLPTKIYRPDFEVLLVDAVRKKVDFMNKVITKLSLKGVNTVHARAEDLAGKIRESYDVAVSRAVAEMRVLVEYTLPFVKPGGVFIAAKGPGVTGEIILARHAINVLGGQVENIKHDKLPVSGDTRVIITIRKVKNTPKKYPRKAGKPRKNPL